MHFLHSLRNARLARTVPACGGGEGRRKHTSPRRAIGDEACGNEEGTRFLGCPLDDPDLSTDALSAQPPQRSSSPHDTPPAGRRKLTASRGRWGYQPRT